MFSASHPPVKCHVSHVTHNVSFVACNMSLNLFNCTIIIYIFVLQSGEAIWWRVCYQWGLPCLVYIQQPHSFYSQDFLWKTYGTIISITESNNIYFLNIKRLKEKQNSLFCTLIKFSKLLVEEEKPQLVAQAVPSSRLLLQNKVKVEKKECLG